MGVISEAWSYLMANIGVWLLAMIAFLGISYGISALCIKVQEVSQNHSSALLGTLASIIPWIVIQLMLGGMIKLAVGTVRTRSAKFSEMWKISNVSLSLLLSAILQGIFYSIASLPGFIVFMISVIIPLMHVGQSAFDFLGTGKIAGISATNAGMSTLGVLIGFLLSIGGMILLASLLFLATPLIVDRKAGPWKANAQSFAALRRHFGAAFTLVAVLTLINMGGFVACCVGLLFTIPLTMLAIALVYRDLFGLGETALQGPFSAPPPIASPNF